jgi:hypothetical protein
MQVVLEFSTQIELNLNIYALRSGLRQHTPRDNLRFVGMVDVLQTIN